MPIKDYPFQRYRFYDRQAVAAVLAPHYTFKPQRGSWGISGIVRYGVGFNYVFFVSFGQTQAGHEFDEAIYSSGVLRWQSQPAQTLTNPTIQRLINHNHLENDIVLFLRTKTAGSYVFMGYLKYVNHDRERERPVHFHWQILDFDPTKDFESLLGLKLEPTPSAAAPIDIPVQQSASQNLILVDYPPLRRVVKGIPIFTADFQRSPVDYEERDRKSRKLGKAGEELVFAYERTELIKAGRRDLAEKVEMVCRTIGDSAGFDIRSFDRDTYHELHIEVKTTSGPLTTPFFMSAAEVQYARTCPKRYLIYRVYAYSPDSSEIQFCTIERPGETMEFTPAVFRVRQKE
jgi:hypothetical protein